MARRRWIEITVHGFFPYRTRDYHIKVVAGKTKVEIFHARHFMQGTCKLCESFLQGVAGGTILYCVKSD